MDKDQKTKILDQLINHEARLRLLEEKGKSTPHEIANLNSRTLREIVKGKKFNNGQERVALIVGYHEVILGQRISRGQIEDEWVNSKMTITFSSVFITRAKDDVIRVRSDDTCDLTQTGEEFFRNLLNNESTSTTSK